MKYLLFIIIIIFQSGCISGQVEKDILKSSINYLLELKSYEVNGDMIKIVSSKCSPNLSSEVLVKFINEVEIKDIENAKLLSSKKSFSGVKIKYIVKGYIVDLNKSKNRWCIERAYIK